jgi:catechol 2,3-dioxygenase-like lactoylglutathione lyase family enzyme
MTAPILRVARPTNDIDALLAFYCDGLGLERCAGFKDHDGFDGVMLGRQGWPYHLEFTCQRGHMAPAAPSPEHLLVFYLPEPTDWRMAIARIEGAGFRPVRAANPYWDRNGRTYADPEGYRVVLASMESPV